MNPSLPLFLLSLLFLYGAVGMILSAFARTGAGVALFLGALWVAYRRRDSIARLARTLDPAARWRAWRKERTYRRMRLVWARILETRAGDMACPGCATEITVFTVSLAGRCLVCGRALLP